MTDCLRSVEDLDSKERMEEEKKEAVDEKEKSEELSTDESPAKMEVDPTDAPSDEEQSMSATWFRIALYTMTCRV